MAFAKEQDKKHVVLIGASVGKAWEFNELTKRVGNDEYKLEYIGKYQFDKSPVLNEILGRKENIPDAIILKECAAYFPSDISFEDAKSLIKGWVDKTKEKGIVPILATIIPVTHTQDEKYKTTNPVKRIVKRILGISIMTRVDRITEYNNWIRQYAKDNNLDLIDLEKSMRISAEDRYLKDEYTKGDGLHLNKDAYAILDQIVIPSLDKVEILQKSAER